jgi:hypothetical protein
MSSVHCFEISLPNIDLDSYFTGHHKVESSHHAHLVCTENEIEIKIFYDPKTMFGHRFRQWASKVKWQNFGAMFKLQEEKNKELQKIDLSQSSLLKILTGSNQYEGDKQFVRLLFDSVKLYWEPNEENLNTAEFYFNDAGFDVVKGYYAVLFNDGEGFEISRMNGLSDFYTIEKSRYRPEFNFWVRDSRNSRLAEIVKEPKIQFQYPENISELDALKYADTICLITSFFFHSRFYFILSRIHLKDYTITVKKVQDPREKGEHYGNLWAFGCDLNFDLFLKSDWQSYALSNFSKLEKSIKMFIQATSVDESSKFLLLYNIIEVCMSGIKPSAEKFEILTDESDKEIKYTEALALLLQTIKKEDHENFITKWQSVKLKLAYKPMKSPLKEFLEDQGFNPSEFPISLNDLKWIRDKITHGTVSGVTPKNLDDANILLYRIAGILILNILGIKDWKLDAQLPA